MGILQSAAHRLKLSISFSDPAQSLTVHDNIELFSLSVDQRKLSTHHGLPLRYRAILTDCLQPCHRWVPWRLASFLSLRMLYRISSRECTGTVQLQSGSLGGCTCPCFSRCCCAWSFLAAWCRHYLCHSRLAQHRAYVPLVQLKKPSTIVCCTCSLEQVSLLFIDVQP